MRDFTRHITFFLLFIINHIEGPHFLALWCLYTVCDMILPSCGYERVKNAVTVGSKWEKKAHEPVLSSELFTTIKYFASLRLNSPLLIAGSYFSCGSSRTIQYSEFSTKWLFYSRLAPRKYLSFLFSLPTRFDIYCKCFKRHLTIQQENQSCKSPWGESLGIKFAVPGVVSFIYYTRKYTHFFYLTREIELYVCSIVPC